MTRLAQVFGNLLGNSAKYTPPGGRIRLAAQADGGHAAVTVSGNGIGIPEASLPPIFDAASDGPGRGATFAVQLPLLRPGPAAVAPTQNGAMAAPGSGCRVLVVDDNRDAAESMAEMLRLLGYGVDLAHDGIQAVEAAERVRPDVVLMDVGMPRMNGAVSPAYCAGVAVKGRAAHRYAQRTPVGWRHTL